MRIRTRPSYWIGLSLLFSFAPALASDADDLRQKAKTIRQEAMELARSGQQEKADRLLMESKLLLEKAEQIKASQKESGKLDKQPERDQRIRQFKEQLQDLLEKQKRLEREDAPEQERKEIRARIEATEKELQQIASQHREKPEIPPAFHPMAEKLEITARRIHHLRVAAENLKLADAHDMAHQLMEKAGIMEQELHQNKLRLADEINHNQHKQMSHDIVNDLRAELEQIRKEVKDLRQRVDKIER